MGRSVAFPCCRYLLRRRSVALWFCFLASFFRRSLCACWFCLFLRLSCCSGAMFRKRCGRFMFLIARAGRLGSQVPAKRNEKLSPRKHKLEPKWLRIPRNQMALKQIRTDASYRGFTHHLNFELRPPRLMTSVASPYVITGL